ncbi:serine/threonine-protein kinase [Undibacterium sp. RTI2.1]|uniref:serine/threonine protein kinase n=1 Tax=unclassified Undibacterium TaxID=2630295 RepID=UPI002AB4C9D9|nr:MULTISPECIES: serine/threonine-protein kinase [unclassified Undibacterium]MDY7537214.1 serine/threonine-protein kinase [Undibacterium sp. 5I1]MEB0031339.1 serine/threonine-protein kinase [Undibacterium sp. RTI2.1]MEB0117708.1 serine/threonine-protein kinase [Undibacterium sp. RTI2.2]MEB0231503.1 serine/threonine-protein kinase [Undibacterium sp. 10I3]MEB0259010.1 serine/threonine-protein kinase [Undibacterium sp. 5I1]
MTPLSSTHPASKQGLPTRRVGRFYLTDKLGKGSNGAVFLGHDPVIDRPVAIKILGTSHGIADKKQREQQFINEARAAGRLSHPNIVTIYDASSEGGTTFIAMEFLQGQDLRELLASGKHFDNIATTTIIHKIAEALAYAHENGVIHRDIKPANIFILPNQQPKVVDFGIARAPNRILTNPDNPAQTLFNNNVLGTPNYMSPEQAMSQQVNALTDVYSLGAVMYEMLTQQKPFQSNDIDKLLNQIAHKHPRSPSELNPAVPSSLSAVVMKAMQKAPAQRYRSAAEMAQALHKILERDQRLKRKRKHAGTAADTSKENIGDERKISWLSWIAVLIALGIFVAYFFNVKP